MIFHDDGDRTSDGATDRPLPSVPQAHHQRRGDPAVTYLKRYNANEDLSPADLDAVRELVCSLGHDGTDDIAATFAVTRDEIGTRLHLTEMLRNDTGFHFLDVAADHIASRPHVHDIDPGALPAAIRPRPSADAVAGPVAPTTRPAEPVYLNAIPCTDCAGAEDARP